MPLRLLIPFALFVVTFALRTPTLALPLEGHAAVLASEAERLGNERGWVTPGTAPVMPLLTSTVVAAGVDPTRALRWVDLLLGCLVAPLGFFLARRLGLGTGVATWLGLLLAVHPLLAVNAGGVHPGPDAAGLVLLLLGLTGLASSRPITRRAGALAGLTLALAHPAGPLYLVPLLGIHAVREPGPRWQVVLPGVGLVVLAAGPLPIWPAGGAAVDLGTLLVTWLPLAGLGIVWLGAAHGLRELLRPPPGGEPLGRRLVLGGWVAGAALHLAALVTTGLGRGARFELDAPAGGALLVPLLLLTGLTGLAVMAARAPRLGAVVRWGRRVAAGMAAAAAVFVVTGPLQVTLFPGRPAAAGRLTWLRQAMSEAASAAGARGWIVLGVAEAEPATQASLADAHPDRAVCRRAPLAEVPEEDGLRVLLPFPASAYPADTAFGLVLPAPRREDAATFDAVTTFGGAAIFEQEPVARVGAYLVMRVQGTMAADEGREDE